MPKAGFWAVGGYTISFRRDGHWYADDERIENPRIELLFSRCIRRDDRPPAAAAPGAGAQGAGNRAQGTGNRAQRTGWLVDVGIDRQPVVVEDTPLVVTSVDGDREAGYTVRTNDGVEESLDPATLEIGGDDVLYCTVDRGERGRLRARFLRPAYYRLARDVEVMGDRAVLEVAGRLHELAAATAC